VFRSQRTLLALLSIAVVGLGATVALAAHDEGFTTSRPAQLVAEPGSGTVVQKILSASDIVPDTGSPAYQMSGIPDGLGAYKDGKHIHVLMNHELGRTFPAVPPGVDARISKITLDGKTRGVVDAEYLFDGSEGFERFCSATLEVINGAPYFFTGEEAIGVSPLVGHDGSSIVMNAETGAWTETPQFGHLNHENVVPVQRLSKFMLVTTDDDFRVGQPAYLYAYIADTFEDAVSGDPDHGSLYVWKAMNPAKTDLAKGETVEGEFVAIPQSLNSDSTELKAAATARQAFRFARLEDAATAQNRPGQLYFTDTGKTGENIVRGAMYRLDIDPSDPTHASVTLLLDGDAPTNDAIFRPDNLDTSPHSVVIQEDGGENRIQVYDIKTGAVRTVARTPDVAWESSGVINAQTLLGNNWWFVDVQSHNSTVPQPGPSLVPDSSVGEDGQLLALYIPNS
jgi:hypothetical protein